MKESQLMNWFFYPVWILTGLGSLALGFFLAMLPMAAIVAFVGDTVLVSGELRVTQDYLTAYAYIPVYGLVVGILQALLLRLKFQRTGGWVWALTTWLAWAFAWFGIGLRFNPLDGQRLPALVFVLHWTLIGALLGLAQERLLQGQRFGVHLPRTGWWVAVNLIGFGVAGLVLVQLNTLAQAAMGFSLPFLVSGGAVWFLVRQQHYLKAESV